MEIFLEIAQEQFGYYKESLFYHIAKGDAIIEFCLTPIMNNMNVCDIDKAKLKKIANTVEQIRNQLVNIKESIDDL